MPEQIKCQPKCDYSDEHYWLALKFIPRLKLNKKLALVERFGLANLFNSPPSQDDTQLTDKQYYALQSPNWSRVEQVIAMAGACQSLVIGFDNKNYPRLLKEIYDPPLVLFVKGNVDCLNRTQIAIVGSRNASVVGRESAGYFAKKLAEHGYIVTSGLALGIDASAHKEVAISGKPTIAVIATGIDKTYPKRHKKLARDIIEAGGAIVSEFLPGTEPKAGHFPKRNRIISGLTRGVLIIEAAIKSGSLITAICIQHELDHLNGVLFVDYLSPLKRKRIQTKLEKEARLAK